MVRIDSANPDPIKATKSPGKINQSDHDNILSKIYEEMKANSSKQAEHNNKIDSHIQTFLAKQSEISQKVDDLTTQISRCNSRILTCSNKESTNSSSILEIQTHISEIKNQLSAGQKNEKRHLVNDHRVHE